MKVTIDWLKKYVDFDSTSSQLAQTLTMIGLEVDSVKKLTYDFDKVVIGRITDVQQHETLPHLKICNVDVGSTTLSLVCGAPNVKKDLKVPVALEGAHLPDGQIIKRTTIHGYDSPGMICSEKELGLSNREDIIMELEADSPIGKDLKEYLAENETVIEIDLTPNRPDCLGLIGVAREIAATNGSYLKKPEIQIDEFEDKKVTDFIEVVIENPENCPRYSARYIEGVKIGPSPRWLVQKLEAVGLRSINNVVDITNYVMMETGQPLHAFDYDLIEGHKIIVKNSRAGQKFTTLDGAEYNLTNDNLMICDAQKPVALAGIMGGLNSEVRETTTKILLESAYFNPTNIRRSSKYLGISTDSSQRFERGVDPNGIIYALNRATQLITEIAGGKSAKGYIDNYPQKIEPLNISLRTAKVNNVLGTNLAINDINRILTSLEFKTKVNTNIIEVQIPTFRPDITREEDLIEEIARIYGYNNIKENQYSNINLLTPKNDFETFYNLARDISVGLGYNEILTNTLISPKFASYFADKEVISVKNPLSEELSVLRPSLIPSLLLIVNWNLNRKNQDLKLFEIGNIFYWQEKDKAHKEEKKIIFGLTGKKMEDTWLDKSRPAGFFDLKGDVETFLARINLENYDYKTSEAKFLDNRSLEIKSHGVTIGFLGAINKNILSVFDIDEDIFIAQLNFNDLLKFRNWQKKYNPIPKFPSIKRDLSILVDYNLKIEDIYSEIWSLKSNILKSVKLFDLYTGKQVEKGKKSLTFSFLFYSEERTLTEKEVDEDMDRIFNALKNRFKAQLRQ